MIVLLVECRRPAGAVLIGRGEFPGDPEVPEVFPTPFPFFVILTPAKFARDDLNHLRHLRISGASALRHHPA
jgi:hypothetical protein